MKEASAIRGVILLKRHLTIQIDVRELHSVQVKTVPILYYGSLQKTAKIFRKLVVKLIRAGYNTIADNCGKPQLSAIGGALYGN